MSTPTLTPLSDEELDMIVNNYIARLDRLPPVTDRRPNGYRTFRKAVSAIFPKRPVTTVDWFGLKPSERERWSQLACNEVKQSNMKTARRATPAKVTLAKVKTPKVKTTQRKRKTTNKRDSMLDITRALKKMQVKDAKVTRAVASAAKPVVAAQKVVDNDVVMGDVRLITPPLLRSLLTNIAQTAD